MSPILRTARAFVRDILVTTVNRRSPMEIASFAVVALVSLGIGWAGGIVLEPTIGPADFPAENGPQELLQAFLLATAALLLYVAAMRLGFEMFYFSLVGALACGLAVLRETPRCGSPYYDGGPCLTSDGKLILGLAIAAAVGGLLAYRRIPLAQSVSELNFFWIVPASLSAAMLIAADILGSRYYAIWEEETLELAAYINFLIFSLALHIWPDVFDSRVTMGEPGAGPDLASDIAASE